MPPDDRAVPARVVQLEAQVANLQEDREALFKIIDLLADQLHALSDLVNEIRLKQERDERRKRDGST